MGTGVWRRLRQRNWSDGAPPILATNVGTLEIGGHVLNDIDITGDITGPIMIAGVLAADISCHSLADLTVTGGTSGGPGTGSLVIYHKALTTIPLSRVIT